MNKTGLYNIDSVTGLKTPCSIGNLSYWKKKLGIMEYDVYLYHKNITGKIGKDVDYEMWTNNAHILKTIKIKTKRKYRNYTLNQYNVTNERLMLIRICNFPNHFENYELSKVRELACEIWEELGLNPKEELKKIQKSILIKRERDELKEEIGIPNANKEHMENLVKKRKNREKYKRKKIKEYYKNKGE